MNNEKGFMEIKMASGWFMTISLQKSDRFEEEKEYIEIARKEVGKNEEGSISIPSTCGRLERHS